MLKEKEKLETRKLVMKYTIELKKEQEGAKGKQHMNENVSESDFNNYGDTTERVKNKGQGQWLDQSKYV